MSGATKLMTAGGGGVNIQPASSIASDVTVNVPSQNCTLGIQGPAFSAYRTGGDQGVSTSTWTKVTLNAEEFDTNNNFDPTTNYRFTPTVAGYYSISGCIFFSGSATFSQARLAIYKNGSKFKQALWAGNVGLGNAINVIQMTVSSVIYFNGSTDYVELYGFTDCGSSAIFVTGADSTYLSGALVRAA